MATKDPLAQLRRFVTLWRIEFEVGVGTSNAFGLCGFAADLAVAVLDRFDIEAAAVPCAALVFNPDRQLVHCVRHVVTTGMAGEQPWLFDPTADQLNSMNWPTEHRTITLDMPMAFLVTPSTGPLTYGCGARVPVPVDRYGAPGWFFGYAFDEDDEDGDPYQTSEIPDDVVLNAWRHVRKGAPQVFSLEDDGGLRIASSQVAS